MTRDQLLKETPQILIDFLEDKGRLEDFLEEVELLPPKSTPPDLFIMYAFSWMESKRGYDFWDNLSVEFHNYMEAL